MGAMVDAMRRHPVVESVPLHHTRTVDVQHRHTRVHHPSPVRGERTLA